MATTTAPTPTPPPPPPTQEYNLDVGNQFDECVARLKLANTNNFAVRFGSDEAHCAVDISSPDEAVKWLSSRSQLDSQALWLNFWAGESQKPIIDAVAKQYDISPRLVGLLCPSMSPPASKTPSSTASGTSGSTSSGQTPKPPTSDVEKGVPPPDPATLQRKLTASQALAGISFRDVVKELWHFCSVDFGNRYIYVGFNAVHPLPEGAEPAAPTLADTSPNGGARSGGSSSKPKGQRIWSSLLICDDGTVISVFERSSLPEGHKLTTRHVLNVFQHLSKLYSKDGSLDALMKIGVRYNDKGGVGYSAKEASSLLFYYLFDDWLTTYALIARRAHPYREKLEVMRRNMFDAAEVSLIRQIHDVGRQLTVLKLVYQSYELIVSRLLHRQRSTAFARDFGLLSRQNTMGDDEMRMVHDTPAAQLTQESLLLDSDSTGVSVKLSLSAVVRFERLLDRIRLYALTEIDECIKEKESLVLMNFNLVALKESQAVERLTRTTILLAKATILFLPVSLMTAYFSIQLPEVAEIYTLKTYWLSFLVVGLLSVVFLLLFGLTSHTLEGKTVYRSITRTLGSMILNSTKRKTL